MSGQELVLHLRHFFAMDFETFWRLAFPGEHARSTVLARYKTFAQNPAKLIVGLDDDAQDRLVAWSSERIRAQRRWAARNVQIVFDVRQ